MKTEATFEIKSWDEKTIHEEQGRKITRSSVVKSYHGGVEGEGYVEYLMAYKPDGSAAITGIERFVGKVGDRDGGFVFLHEGEFRSGKVVSLWTVIDGSGSGALQGLQGSVTFEAGHEKSYPISFEYR